MFISKNKYILNMSKELNLKYVNVYRFIEAFKGFEQFYKDNMDSEIDFTEFLTKLSIFDNFVSSVIEKMDSQTGYNLIKNLESDSDFILKAIEDKIHNKNDLLFLNKTKSLVQISDSSDLSDDSDSVSSIEDINSIDSSSDDEEDENEYKLSSQTKKMMANSLIELKIRKRDREFDIEKIEEE